MQKMLLTLTVLLADAANASEDRYICPVHPDGGEWKLVSAVWIPDTAVSTDASNYRTISLKRSSTTFGSLTTNSSGGAAFVEGTPQAFTLTASGTDQEFTANTDALEIDSTYTGTGAAAAGRVVVCFERMS